MLPSRMSCDIQGSWKVAEVEAATRAMDPRAIPARKDKSAAAEPLAEFAIAMHGSIPVSAGNPQAALPAVIFWLLAVIVFSGIAAASVTHEDILVDAPIRLPFLNVGIPLVAFFAVTPVLFLALEPDSKATIARVAGLRSGCRPV